MTEEGIWIQESQKIPLIKDNNQETNFGGIELILSLIEPKINKIELKLTNHSYGLILPYYFKRKIEFKNKLTIIVFLKNEPIQTIVFQSGFKYGHINPIGEKDLKNFVLVAKVDYDNKVFFLKWNRKQKSKSTLLVVKYESQEM